MGRATDIMKRPSSTHGRSYMLTDEIFNRRWTDEYGNTYEATSLKGNNFTSPDVTEHPTAALRYIAYGLQESAIIERVLKASRLLCEIGVSTEKILGIAEPKIDQYPWPLADDETDHHELIDLADYKIRIIEKYIQRQPKEKQTIAERLGMMAVFQDTTFYISLRATDSPYRLGDIKDKKRLARVYEQINMRLLFDGEEPLDVENAQDIRRYTKNYLAPNVARNLARLHGADLTHGFVYAGNLTALGAIVDLDSVHGEPLGLGDQPVTDMDIARDIRDALSIFMLDEFYDPPAERKPNNPPATIRAFLDTYIDEYLSDHEEKTDSLTKLSKILQTLNNSNYAYRHDSDKHDMWLATLNHMFNKVFDVLTQDLEDRYDPENPEEGKDYVVDILSINPEIYECARKTVTNTLHIYKPFIFSHYADEISEAYQRGAKFNIAQAFMNEKDRAKFARGLMTEEIVRPVMNMITDNIITKSEHVRVTDHARIMQMELADPKSKSRQIILDVLNYQLLPEIEKELMESLSYDAPESILPKQRSEDCLLINDGQMWVVSGGVELDEIYDNAPDGFDSIQFNLFEKGSETKVFNHKLDSNSEITQFITNIGYDKFQGVRDVDVDGNQYVTVVTEPDCEYVCIVHVDDSGRKKLHLYCDEAYGRRMVDLVSRNFSDENSEATLF